MWEWKNKRLGRVCVVRYGAAACRGDSWYEREVVSGALTCRPCFLSYTQPPPPHQGQLCTALSTNETVTLVPFTLTPPPPLSPPSHTALRSAISFVLYVGILNIQAQEIDKWRCRADPSEDGKGFQDAPHKFMFMGGKLATML